MMPPQNKEAGPRSPGVGGGRGPVVRASGELWQKPLAWVLLDAMDGRYMGYLDLRRQKIQKRVVVLMGYPVFVESALRSETLGQLLVSSGRLRPEQHRQALQLMTDQRVMYGEALLRLELMKEQEVLQTLEIQVRRKLEPCLSWREGTWEYLEDPAVGAHAQRHTVDPVELVFGSLPRYVNMEQELEALGQEAGAHRLELLPRGRALAHRFSACFGQRLLDELEQGRSVSELLDGQDLHETVEQVHVLLQCGMAHRVPMEAAADVEVAAAGGRGRDALDLERLAARATTTRMQPVAPPGPEGGGQGDAVAHQARELIESTYLALFGQDHYQALGLARACSAAELEAGYRARRDRFAAAQFSGVDLGEEGDYLDEIRGRLDEAYRALADVGERRQYDADLQQLQQSHDRLCAEGLAAAREDGAPDVARSVRAERACGTGEFLARQGSHKEAAEAFSAASQEDDQAEYRTMEAWSLYRANGETPEAATTVLPMVLEELERTPDQYMIHLVAARLHRGAEQYEQALEQYQAVFRLNPCLRRVMDELEEFLHQTDQAEQLDEQYRRILLHLGDRDHDLAADIWKRLTVLYHRRLEDDDRARTALEVARYMDGDDPQVQELELELELELFPDDED